MPDLAENIASWEDNYDWESGGEEWSVPWGNSEAQWFGSIYPRIHRFLPAEHILEIAPGFGRWTRFLTLNSDRYTGVDLSERCIDTCRRRFNNVKHASFLTNNGLSLADVSNGSCNFVFSFDSLVHADLDVLQSYIPEILRVLATDGVAFIHHSNLLALDDAIGQPHWRSLSVSADNVASTIDSAGGSVIIQEIINWGGDHMIDCFTLFSKQRNESASCRLQNYQFAEEVDFIREFQSPWSKVTLANRQKPPVDRGSSLVQAARIRSLEAQLDAFRASTSWRITAPLRRVRSLFSWG